MRRISVARKLIHSTCRQAALNGRALQVLSQTGWRTESDILSRRRKTEVITCRAKKNNQRESAETYAVEYDGGACYEPAGCPVNPETLFEGIDTTNSSYGEVTLSGCQHCSTALLRFFIEYESFSRCGRWYCAPVPCEREVGVTAESAIETLNSLEPQFADGSYFNFEGFETKAPVNLQP